MGFMKWLRGTPEQPVNTEPKPDIALQELICSYKERVSELRVGNEELKQQNQALQKRVDDLRFQLESIPRVDRPSETSVYEYSAEQINDQPSFSQEGDAKQIQEFDAAAIDPSAWLAELTQLTAQHDTAPQDNNVGTVNN